MSLDVFAVQFICFSITYPGVLSLSEERGDIVFTVDVHIFIGHIYFHILVKKKKIHKYIYIYHFFSILRTI